MVALRRHKQTDRSRSTPRQLLAHQGAVAVLASPGRQVGKQVHEGATKGAAGRRCEGHEPVAACSVPLILECYVLPSSGAIVCLRSGHAVCGGLRVDGGNVTHTLLPLEGVQ
jgi:hypothetical protein